MQRARIFSRASYDAVCLVLGLLSNTRSCKDSFDLCLVITVLDEIENIKVRFLGDFASFPDELQLVLGFDYSCSVHCWLQFREVELRLRGDDIDSIIVH